MSTLCIYTCNCGYCSIMLFKVICRGGLFKLSYCASYFIISFCGYTAVKFKLCSVTGEVGISECLHKLNTADVLLRAYTMWTKVLEQKSCVLNSGIFSPICTCV